MRLIAFLILLLSTSVAVANGPPVGVGTNADGYIPDSNGYYFWWGTQAYTRVWVQPAAYYVNTCYNGCYVNRLVYPAGYWSYTYASTYTVPTVTAQTPGWRNRLLDIAAARDKAEATVRLGAFEQAYFMQSLKALGMEGNFNWQGYGITPPYGAYGGYGASYNVGTLQLSSAGAQGNTAYGYSFNQVADFYGDKNLALLYQQLGRTTDAAQSLAGRAATDLASIASQEGGNRAKLAEIFAKQEAVKSYLSALQGNGGKITTQTYSYRVGPGKDGQIDVQPMDKATGSTGGQGLEQWRVSAQQCMGCHSGKRVEGGFDVTQYPGLTTEQKIDVFSRLVNPDPSKRMPRGADGRAAARLSANELALWLVN